MLKPIPRTPLSFEEIIMRADADTLRAALEARLKIDDLLKEREAAYRRIAELENQVDDIIGQPGVFVFPAPPIAVATVAKAPSSGNSGAGKNAEKKNAVSAETVDTAE